MNILNKIIIVILVPIFILAEVQRAPGQPSARPIKHKQQQKLSSATTSQYVLTVKKSSGKSPEYNINLRPIDATHNSGIIANSQPFNLSTNEPDDAIERIEYGNWRD